MHFLSEVNNAPKPRGDLLVCVGGGVTNDARPKEVVDRRHLKESKANAWEKANERVARKSDTYFAKLRKKERKRIGWRVCTLNSSSLGLVVSKRENRTTLTNLFYSPPLVRLFCAARRTQKVAL